MKSSHQTVPPLASVWLRAVAAPDTAAWTAFADAWGSRTLAESRLPIVAAVLRTFIARFGDLPVRIVRCPGRINLRGMHVDTHGGFLNLMTHHREVIVVSAASANGTSTFVNTDDAFEEVTCSFGDWPVGLRFPSWATVIADPLVQQRVRERRGHWSNYLVGAIVRARYHGGETVRAGVQAAIGSDIPRGASLSSSTALSIAVFMSIAKWNAHNFTAEALIPVAQDIEWFAGARIGTSDQSAMLLPRAGELLNVVPGASASSPEIVRSIAFPDSLRVLVTDSRTERSLSGAEQIAYTQNRFAYSIALEILRAEMLADDVPAALTQSMTRLADFSPERLAALGGATALYRWIRKIPLKANLEMLRGRYQLADLNAAYEQYFGSAPEAERPTVFQIRGPLLFGIAESERARVFVEAIAMGDFTRAGRLMSIGHDGDRRYRDGQPWRYPTDDAAIAELEKSATPIELVPGDYGASSWALDAIVDRAQEAGALGASLTGAGIAGSVLALCRAEDTRAVARSIEELVMSEKYQSTVGARMSYTTPLVVTNDSPCPAGELSWAST